MTDTQRRITVRPEPDHERVRAGFAQAGGEVSRAITALDDLRLSYIASEHVQPRVKLARIDALTAKIHALQAVALNGDAAPWDGDAL